MNYHDLKVLHIFLAILALSMSSALFYGGSTKARQIVLGLSFLLLFGTGFMIMGRFGIKHAGPWPFWINIKMGIWLALTVGTPIAVKRFPERTKRLFWPWMIVALVAVSMAVYKPM